MSDYPDTWVKHPHHDRCDGGLYRLKATTCVDVLGRRGNGGIVVHQYRCDRHWKGCPAEVLVAEQAVRLLAVGALAEVQP